MRKFRLLLASLIVGAGVIGFSACEATNEPGTHADKVIKQQKAETKGKTEGVKTEAKPDPTAGWTESQKQATAKAEDYLDYDSFSKSGLADQLKYEGFSKPDAEFAVNHIKVDWMKQAAAKAADYLDYDSFSHSGLVDQLKYEGFTPEQAEYGTTQAGL